MKIVLDTNILLVSISKRSKYYWVFEAFLSQQYQLIVTTDILHEYEEIIGQHMGKEVANTVLQIIENAPNVQIITRYYKWRLIEQDPDDNKFVDCAIAGNAHYLVSHYRHFKVLETIDFPKVKVVDIISFENLLKK